MHHAQEQFKKFINYSLFSTTVDGAKVGYFVESTKLFQENFQKN